MKDWFGFLLFVAGIAALAFLLGLSAGIFRVFPYTQVADAYTALAQVVAGLDGKSAKEHYLLSARYDGESVRVYVPELAQDGLTLLTSHWPKDDELAAGARLVDMQGEVLHEWWVDPQELWPVSPYDDYASGKYNKPQNYIHGTYLFPNGDLLLNIEYLGLVRLSACSEVVWQLPYRTHHSVHRDDDGNFWVAGLNWRMQPVEQYVHLKPPFVDETLLKVSPDGTILDEIFVLQSIYDSNLEGFLTNIVPKFDITHMNDVEPLSAAMAAAFPMFSPGDLLVSLRNLNLVLVIDSATHEVKWFFRDPLIHQHDPDFESDGRIVVFDNQDDTTETGERNRRSRLLSIDPASGRMTTIFPVDPDEPFYTQQGGKHQLLANGNRLLTEAGAGRVIEVSAGGEIVWDWLIAATPDGYVPEVLEGARFPADYLQPDALNCAR